MIVSNGGFTRKGRVYANFVPGRYCFMVFRSSNVRLTFHHHYIPFDRMKLEVKNVSCHRSSLLAFYDVYISAFHILGSGRHQYVELVYIQSLSNLKPTLCVPFPPLCTTAYTVGYYCRLNAGFNVQALPLTIMLYETCE